MRRGTMIAAIAIASACGTIGEEQLEEVPAPHNGAGPFRPFTQAETGVPGRTAGRVLASRGAVAAPMTAEGHLFYAAAELLPDAMPPMEPGDDIDWSLFAPPEIHRAPPGDERMGFPIGAAVLRAEEAWEGAGVTDPWVVALPEGGVLLYYVGDGGIGLAEAPAIDAAFTRVSGAPILTPEAGETLGRPSVVLFEGTFFLYFETGTGEIALAESEDGRSFARMGTLAVGRGPVDGEPDELSVWAPGAGVVTTAAGRSFIRLYLESRREDGTRLISLAASDDGREFERLERPVVETLNTGEPAPMFVDERVTVLFYTAHAIQSGAVTRAIVGGVAPRSFSF